MSDNDDDLFADSDDTAELIGNSKPETKKAAPKRKRNEGTAKLPDADDNGDDSDSDSDDDSKGLFDSDDSDDDDAAAKKPAAKKAKKAAAAKKPIMTKRERMEALQKKKRAASGIPEKPVVDGVPSEKKKRKKEAGGDGNNSDSEDSYNSREFQLTEDDRNFIDTEGDDADALNELYSEQHFDDARGEAEEDDGYKKKKGRKGGSASRARSEASELSGADPDNPIMAAVHRMKKKKREAKKLTELEEDAKEFMDRMERAAEDDELAVKERRPATKKLALLKTVVAEFTKRDMTRVLLDLDVLSICRRWIQPLPNGTLGNVTVRQRLLDSIANMTGEMGVTPGDLKRSEFGKVVMSLYMHKSETPGMKRRLKSLIEQWSRPIFQKSGNMRDLERVVGRGDSGIAGISRVQMQKKNRMESVAKGPAGGSKKDIDSIIKSGKGKGSGSGLNRVRVPYSKGFQFTVRPSARDDMQQTPDKGAGRGQEVRGNLAKRMVEKGRAVAKNQRSANISVEGRATKG